MFAPPRIVTRTALTTLLSIGLVMTLLACSGDAQSLRDRLKARIAERKAGASTSGGLQTVSISVGGLERRFLVHVPATVEARPGAILVLHGGRGTGEGIMETSGMNAAADEGGFLAVYPEAAGEGARWNSGTAVSAGGPDDIAYLRAVIAMLQNDYNLDPARVFATGISSGGSMLYGIACQAPDLVGAIAPVASNLSEGQRAACAPGGGTPIMMFSGTADPLMTFTGGPATLQIGNQPENAGTDPLMSAPDTLAFWAGVNGCGPASETELRDSSNDGTTVTEISHDCGANATTMYRINGGGHAWPGSASSRKITGPTSKDISATATMVQFFAAYGL